MYLISKTICEKTLLADIDESLYNYDISNYSSNSKRIKDLRLLINDLKDYDS